MAMKSNLIQVFLVVFMTAGGLSAFADDDEVEIPLKDVPKKVMEVAKAKLKGIVFTEAEVEKKQDRTVYELEGKLNGIEYEIKITLNKKGEIIKVEVEEDD
jgi:uncharacterized membrane protein YkoI